MRTEPSSKYFLECLRKSYILINGSEKGFQKWLVNQLNESPEKTFQKKAIQILRR